MVDAHSFLMMSAREAEGWTGETKTRFVAAGGPPDRRRGDDTIVVTRTRTELKRPKLYRVLLFNDDYTPMEFVVNVLQRFFNKGMEEATAIMLQVHRTGIGECGVYTYEVADTKVNQVMDYSARNQHPLRCDLEEK